MAMKMRFEMVPLDEFTRRERSTFEHESGMNWVECMRVMSRIQDEDGDLSAMESYTDFETALLAVAVRRKLGREITFDQVLDAEDWQLKEAKPADGDNPKGGEGTETPTSTKPSKKT
jgi:hypothetical protein